MYWMARASYDCCYAIYNIYYANIILSLRNFAFRSSSYHEAILSNTYDTQTQTQTHTHTHIPWILLQFRNVMKSIRQVLRMLLSDSIEVKTRRDSPRVSLHDFGHSYLYIIYLPTHALKYMHSGLWTGCVCVCNCACFVPRAHTIAMKMSHQRRKPCA